MRRCKRPNRLLHNKYRQFAKPKEAVDTIYLTEDIYDVTNIPSFEDVKKWALDIKNKALSNEQVIIVGNKIEDEEKRKVTREEGEKFAEELGFPFYE